MATKRMKIAWLDEPEETNYPAAVSYLSLVFPPKRAKALVKELVEAKVTTFKSKDIFRASQLSQLGVSNYHVERDLKKVREGKRISPILLVRMPDIARVIVADGYHRLCAVYALDEDALIPCKIV